MKQLQSSHGGALLITLGLMLMLTIAAIMAVNTAQTDIDLSFNQLNSDLAFYVAEAGLKRAFVDLNANNALDTAYTQVSFERGIYSTIIIHGDTANRLFDTVTIKSAGSVEDANANITALAVPELIYPFQFAMFGEDGISMVNNTITDSYNSDSGTYATTVDTLTGGDIASNGTIFLDQSAYVSGDVTTSDAGGITVDATCTVTGLTDDSVDPYELDSIPRADFDAAAADNDNMTGITGDYSWTVPMPSLELGTSDTAYLHTGVYYFRDITLTMNSCLMVAPGDSVVIYLDGTLTLENNTSVNPTEDPADCMIFSDGQIVSVGNDTEICAAFYGPDADVDLGQSCDWYGSIIAESVEALNTGSIHYDVALGKVAYGTTGKMLMIAWQEN